MFHIHLLTAIVLMFVVGAFVGANLPKRYEQFDGINKHVLVEQGWPIKFLVYSEDAELQRPQYFWIDCVIGIIVVMLSIRVLEAASRRHKASTP